MFIHSLIVISCAMRNEDQLAGGMVCLYSSVRKVQVIWQYIIGSSIAGIVHSCCKEASSAMLLP